MNILQKLIGIIFISSFSLVKAENSAILENQFKADFISLILVKSKKLGSDYKRPKFTKEQLQAGAIRTMKRISSRSPNYFITTANEEAKLKNNEHIITKKQLTESITKLKRMSLNPELPALLVEYEKISLKSDLNPAQRLLAYKLSENLISKIEANPIDPSN